MATHNKPYRLTLVLQDLEFGGTQRYALNLLQHLDRSLFAPELLVLRGGRDMAAIAEKTGVRIQWLSTGRQVTPAALWRLFLTLARNRPVILHPLTVVPNIWARLFGSLLRIPIIVSSYRNLKARQYESLLWRLSTHIICNAEAVREKLIQSHGADPHLISVVPNGVDTDYFQPCHKKRSPAPLVLFAGRLVRQKDPLSLLKAFRIVQQTLPESRLLVIGNGPLAAAMESYIREGGLDGTVVMQPGTTEIRDALQQATVFLLPSLYEGSPNSIIEAMACGLPVVATRTSGIPELIVHGVNGYMVPVGDYPKMAEYIVRLLADEEARTRMGRLARETVVQSHDLHNCVRLTEQILLARLE